MARLYLFVEGKTEQTFANTVLSPHLAHFGVYLQPAVEIAHSRSRGRAHRGGGRAYRSMRNDIERFTKQEKGRGVYFSTLIDLYQIAPELPGLAEAERFRFDPYQRVRALQESWAADLPDGRFIPFIALHEFEAYVLAQPEQLELFYSDQPKGIVELRKLVDSVGSPELINDGPTTAPSKRIIQQFPDYKRAKALVGAAVAESIGLARIRQCCPHFDGWISRLEKLGETSSLVLGE